MDSKALETEGRSRPYRPRVWALSLVLKGSELWASILRVVCKVVYWVWIPK